MTAQEPPAASAISVREWSRRWLLCVGALAVLVGSYVFVMSARPDIVLRTASPREWASGTSAGLKNARRSFPFRASEPTGPHLELSHRRWRDAGVRRFTDDHPLPIGTPRRSGYGADWSTYVRAFNRATERRLSDERQIRIRTFLLSLSPTRAEQDAILATASEDLTGGWIGNPATPDDDQSPPELPEIAVPLSLELGLSILVHHSGTQPVTFRLDRFSGISPVPLETLRACDVRYHRDRRLLLLRERSTDRRIVFHVPSWTVLSEDAAP